MQRTTEQVVQVVHIMQLPIHCARYSLTLRVLLHSVSRATSNYAEIVLNNFRLRSVTMSSACSRFVSVTVVLKALGQRTTHPLYHPLYLRSYTVPIPVIASYHPFLVGK